MVLLSENINIGNRDEKMFRNSVDPKMGHRLTETPFIHNNILSF